MLRYIATLLFAVCLFPIPASFSNAITLVSTDASGAFGPQTEFSLLISDGFTNDFVVFMCGTFSDGGNAFLNPTPDDWTTLTAGTCGGSGNCLQGIFAGTAPSAGDFFATCRWTDTISAVTAGAFRYRGVDPETPVIDVACDTGAIPPIIAPSVVTEANSVVIRTFTQGAVLLEPFNAPAQVLESQFQSVTVSDNQLVNLLGTSFAFEEGGPTGELDFADLPNGAGIQPSAGWRACTIALRGIDVSPDPIPTLSEWGFIVFIALTGVVSIWALRRRARTA